VNNHEDEECTVSIRVIMFPQWRGKGKKKKRQQVTYDMI
jgi:hypothetical protein